MLSFSLPDDASGSEWYPSLQQDKAGGEAGGAAVGGSRAKTAPHPLEKLINNPAAALNKH